MERCLGERSGLDADASGLRASFAGGLAAIALDAPEFAGLTGCGRRHWLELVSMRGSHDRRTCIRERKEVPKASSTNGQGKSTAGSAKCSEAVYDLACYALVSIGTHCLTSS